VQEHQGAIEVDSVLGRGTTFRLEFPISIKRVIRTPESIVEAMLQT
jgi:signal transduction histidine kinase